MLVGPRPATITIRIAVVVDVVTGEEIPEECCATRFKWNVGVLKSIVLIEVHASGV